MAEPTTDAAQPVVAPAVRGGGRGGRGRGGGGGPRGGGAGPKSNGTGPLKQQPNGGGIAHHRGGHDHRPPRAPKARQHSSAPSNEAEEVKHQRKKYGAGLTTIKELFPEWSDEDLLMTLGEANGDLELAITRISEGHASQWGSVKTKKEKKATPSTTTPAAGGWAVADSKPVRGGSEARGRGRADGLRGGRGGGRGGRGFGRGGFTNASGPRAPDNDTAVESSTTPSGWGDPEPTTAAAEAPVASWGDEPLEAPPAATNGTAPALTAAGWGDEPKPKSKVIPTGSKMSWAQIARPAEPLKPAPLQEPEPAPVEAKQTEPTVAQPAAQPEPPQITIPDASADVWNATPAAADNATDDGRATAPSVWNDDIQPMGGVGEGWAETVLAQPSAPAQQASLTDKASVFDGGALTPSNAVDIAPLQMDHTTPAKAAPTASQTASTGHGHSASGGIGAPPGLGSKRMSHRAGKGNLVQDAAVVMPSGTGTPGAGDRIGLQFGSLSLFDQGFGQAAPSEAVQDARREEPVAPEPSAPNVPAAADPVAQPLAQPSAYEAPQPQSQAPQQSLYGQQPTSAFAARYPTSTSQYAPSEPASAPAAQPDAFSQYARYSQPDAVAAYFAQHQQPPAQQQQTPAPAAQPQAQPQPASGYFNPMQQQPQQQQQQQQQQQPGQQPQQQQPSAPQAQSAFGQAPYSSQDYSGGVYGQEALRSLGYYDTYAHAQAAQAAAFQNRTPNPPEEANKATPGTQAGQLPSQPQQAQQQPPSAGQQQYPGIAPSMGYPYPYYYGQYGQLPPGYGGQPGYPYGMQAAHSPYYSTAGQYGAARGQHPGMGQQQPPSSGAGAGAPGQQAPPSAAGASPASAGLAGSGYRGGQAGPVGGLGQHHHHHNPAAPAHHHHQHQLPASGHQQPYAAYANYGAYGGQAVDRQAPVGPGGPASERKDAFSFSSDRFFNQ